LEKGETELTTIHGGHRAWQLKKTKDEATDQENTEIPAFEQYQPLKKSRRRSFPKKKKSSEKRRGKGDHNP